jgi:DNA-binding MarR family transcriptional regulator
MAPMTRTGPQDDYALSRLKVAASPLYLREAEVQRGVALLLLGQSHLLRAIDPELRAAGIGRAHSRMLGHVARWPGLTMSDLIDLTGTSKQALSRVARDLVDRGLVEVTAGALDKRRREVRPTDAGQKLSARIDQALGEAMSSAYSGAGQEAVTGFWHVLEGLVPVQARMQMTRLGKS